MKPANVIVIISVNYMDFTLFHWKLFRLFLMLNIIIFLVIISLCSSLASACVVVFRIPVIGRTDK